MANVRMRKVFRPPGIRGPDGLKRRRLAKTSILERAPQRALQCLNDRLEVTVKWYKMAPPSLSRLLLPSVSDTPPRPNSNIRNLIALLPAFPTNQIPSAVASLPPRHKQAATDSLLTTA